MADTILPFELVIIILHDLRDQTTDLRNCTLVCERWRTQAQAFLLHTAVVATVKQCNQFCCLLTESPHIAPLIKEVSFNLDIGTLNDTTLVTIDMIIRSLRLECLALGALREPVDDLNASDLPPILWGAIAFSIGHASLSSLKLRSFSLSASNLQTLFTNAPGLRNLYLSHISCVPSDDVDALGFQTRIKELVVVSDDNGVLEWLAHSNCSIDLACLQSLTIAHGMDHIENGFIDAIVQKVGPSLESLYLRHVNERPMKEGLPLNLRFNPYLRSLRLNLAPDDRYSINRCPPKWVLSTLERISSPVSVEELILDIGIVDTLSFKRTDYGRWQQMAALLSTNTFPGLQCVKIIIADTIIHLPLIEELATQAMQRLGVVWAFEMADELSTGMSRTYFRPI